MAKFIKVRLKKSYKDGAPGVGTKIIYFGHDYKINLDDEKTKKDYEYFKAKGAFSEVKKTKKSELKTDSKEESVGSRGRVGRPSNSASTGQEVKTQKPEEKTVNTKPAFISSSSPPNFTDEKR